MKRIRSLFLIFFILIGSMAGLWGYMCWREGTGFFEKQQIKNAYIIKEKGDKLRVYTDGREEEYTVKSNIRDEEYRGIADVHIRWKNVDRIVCKPEKIGGKILAIKEEALEIEDYGVLSLDSGCTCYRLSEKIQEAEWEELEFGQTDVTFVVAEGRICSILFPSGSGGEKEGQPEAGAQGGVPAADTGQVEQAGKEVDETIRVAIKTDGFESYEHRAVTLRGTKKIIVKNGKEEREYQPGEEVTFTADSMKENRSLVTSEEGGRIQLTSVKRGDWNPVYRGRIEVERVEGGFHIINELLLEEYLYGVLPSEMPAEYGKEALKAQAVCARSYAARHRKNNRLRSIGAHVDDSVSYQVYNNTKEDERCNQAVDETRGEKAYYEGKIAATYFFSTSCGVTTSAEDVWFSKEEVPYLTGCLQKKAFTGEDEVAEGRLVSGMLGEEDLFRKFLKEDRDVLDKNEGWYRWSTSVSLGDMEHTINTKIGERCQADNEKIQVRQPDGSYKPQQIEGIGTLKRVKIKLRKNGGVVYMAVLVGSEATVRVYSEYNIRLFLFHDNAIIRKNDGKEVSGLTMLPSGFFVMRKSGSTYQFEGGGFGHGTGMSQTGANELAQEGRGYKEILKYYFSGIDVRQGV